MSLYELPIKGVGFSKLFPGLTARLLVLSGQFNFPNLVYREAVLATGKIFTQKLRHLLVEKRTILAIWFRFYVF